MLTLASLDLHLTSYDHKINRSSTAAFTDIVEEEHGCAPRDVDQDDGAEDGNTTTNTLLLTSTFAACGWTNGLQYRRCSVHLALMINNGDSDMQQFNAIMQ